MEESLLRKQQQTISIERTEETQRNQNAFLKQNMQEETQTLSPDLQREALYQSVTESRKWCGDSDQMKEIKWQIEKLKLLQRLGDKADPVNLMREYVWMIDLCRLYLQDREKEGAYYSDRHKLVRNLLESCRKDRDALMDKNGHLEEDAFASEHKSAFDAALKGPKTREHVKELMRRMSKGMPPSEEAFREEQKEILSLYDRVIRQYEKENESICILTSSKKKRAEATRILRQLSRERTRIRKMNFQNTNAETWFRSWAEGFGGNEIRTIDEGFLKRNPELKVVSPVQERGYGIVSEMLGAESLFTFEKKVRYRDKHGIEYESYLRTEKEELTLEQAIQEAGKQKLPLMYSENAMQKLATAQIIDFIMGQTGRTQDSFRVQIDVRNVENVDYLVITDVTITDHAESLGEEKPEELNQEEKRKSTRKIYDEEDKLLIYGYDRKVADKIMELDGERLATYFKTLGVEEAGLEAMKLRLDKMKKLLQKDKESGKRKALEDQEKDLSNNPQLLTRIKRSGYIEASPHTYILTSLIQDYGNRNNYEVQKINRNTEYDLNSTKEEGERRKRIEKRLEEGNGGYAGTPLQKESAEVLDEIRKYMKVSVSAEVLRWQYGTGGTIEDVLSEFEKEREEEVKERAIERLKKKKQDISDEKLVKEEMRKLLIEEEGGSYQYMQRLRPKLLLAARNKIQARIEAIEKKKKEDIGPYEEEELSRLKEYLKDLVVKENVSGDLQYRPKDAWKMGDKKLESSLRFVSAKDQPLFPEDPKISDVVQGQVGDCYFMSVLGAVVESDPQFIRDHMKDNGDGTVTVKLYRPNMIGSGYSPLLITVDKTVAYQGSTLRGAETALWVQLYEKALVLSGLKTDTHWFKKYKYDEICGGEPDEALGWITGKKGEKLFDHLGDRKESVEGGISEEWKKYDPKTKRTYLTEKFYEEVKTVKESLKALLDEGAVVTADTYNTFSGATETGYNGERRRRGIASRHSYTVIGMEEINGKTYVRVRNPWGTGAVDTVMNELTGETMIKETAWKDKSYGSFLMDINTFVEHMAYVSFVRKKNIKGMNRKGNQPGGTGRS